MARFSFIAQWFVSVRNWCRSYLKIFEPRVKAGSRHSAIGVVQCALC
jgi:hypothetical protein